MKQIGQELRAHLVANGLVRYPKAAGELPPCWFEDDEGIPSSPAAGAPATVLLASDGAEPNTPGEGFLYLPRVKVLVRSQSAKTALQLCDAIHDLLNDKWAETIGSVEASEVLMAEPFERIGSETGFDYQGTVRFVLLRSQLAE